MIATLVSLSIIFARFITPVLIAKGALTVPVVEHCDIGLESLSRRLSGSILFSRDSLGELVDGIAFVYISRLVLLDDIKTFGCDCDWGLFKLFCSFVFVFVFMSH